VDVDADLAPAFLARLRFVAHEITVAQRHRDRLHRRLQAFGLRAVVRDLQDLGPAARVLGQVEQRAGVEARFAAGHAAAGREPAAPTTTAAAGEAPAEAPAT